MSYSTSYILTLTRTASDLLRDKDSEAAEVTVAVEVEDAVDAVDMGNLTSQNESANPFWISQSASCSCVVLVGPSIRSGGHEARADFGLVVPALATLMQIRRQARASKVQRWKRR